MRLWRCGLRNRGEGEKRETARTPSQASTVRPGSSWRYTGATSIITLLGPPPPDLVAKCNNTPAWDKFFSHYTGLFDVGIPSSWLPQRTSWEEAETTLVGQGQTEEQFLQVIRKVQQWLRHILGCYTLADSRMLGDNGKGLRFVQPAINKKRNDGPACLGMLFPTLGELLRHRKIDRKTLTKESAKYPRLL